VLEFVTPETVREVIRLRRDAHAAVLRRDAGRPIWEDFTTCEPYPWTPEETAFKEYLFGLSQDELRELQALFWLGCPRTTESQPEQVLRDCLDYSWSNDDHMPEYLFSKNIILATALEQSLSLLRF
jgi:hypothetical protein